MDDLFGGTDAAEFEDVSSVEGSKTERVDGVVAALDLLDFVLDNIVSLTFVGHHLSFENTADDIDVSVVEAETMGGSRITEISPELQSFLIKIITVDLL